MATHAKGLYGGTVKASAGAGSYQIQECLVSTFPKNSVKLLFLNNIIMARIPEIIIEQVLERADIVDVIREYVTLKKDGVNYKGRCPFHNELRGVAT